VLVEEVAFEAGEEEDAAAGDLGSSAASTDDEQRLKAPERRPVPDSPRVQERKKEPSRARPHARARARQLLTAHAAIRPTSGAFGRCSSSVLG